MSASSQIRAGGAYVEIVADDRKLRKGLQKAQTRMRSFSETVRAIGADLLSVTAIGGSAFALPLRSFAKFDDQIRTTAAISRASAREIDALRKSARDLGATTAFTAQQVAEGQTSFARMGMSARNIKGAIKPVLDLVRATGNGTETLGQASLAVGTILRSFNLGDSAEQVRDVVDVLTSAANMSATDLWSFMESMKLVGPVARDAGADLRDVASQLMVLANAGLRGTEAGTALRRAYASLAKDGGKKFQELGINVARSDGNLRTMSEILTDLGEALRQMPNTKRLEILNDIFGVRGMTGVSNLINGLNQLVVVRDKLNKVNGVAGRTAEEQEKGIGGQLRKLVAAAEEFNLALGEAFSKNGGMGMIAQMADAIRTLAAVIKELGPAIGLLGRLGVYMLVFKTGASLLRGFSGLLAPATKRIDDMFYAFVRLAKGADISAGAMRLNQRFLRERNNDLAKLNELQEKSMRADTEYRAAVDKKISASRNLRGAITQHNASYHALGSFVPRSMADAIRAVGGDPIKQASFRELMDESNAIRQQIVEQTEALSGLTGVRQTARRFAVRRNRQAKVLRGARMRDFGTRVFAMEDARVEREITDKLNNAAKEARDVARDFGAPENKIEDEWYREAKQDADRKTAAARRAGRERARHILELRRKVARSGQNATGAWERYYDTSVATEGAERRFAEAGGQGAIDQAYQNLDKLNKRLMLTNKRLREQKNRAYAKEYSDMQREDNATLRNLERERDARLREVEAARKDLEKATAAARGAKEGKVAANAAYAGQQAYAAQTPFQREMQYWQDRETLAKYQGASGKDRIAMQNEYNQALARTGMTMTDVGKATRNAGVVTEGAMLRAQKGRAILAQINAANMGFIKTLRRRFQVYQSLSIQELAMAKHGVKASNARRMAFLAEAAAIKGVGKGVSWFGSALAPLLTKTNILLLGVTAAWWGINKAIDAHNEKIRKGIAARQHYRDMLSGRTRDVEEAQGESASARQWLVAAYNGVKNGGKLGADQERAAMSALNAIDVALGKRWGYNETSDFRKFFGFEAGRNADVDVRVGALVKNLLEDTTFNNAKFLNAEIAAKDTSLQNALRETDFGIKKITWRIEKDEKRRLKVLSESLDAMRREGLSAPSVEQERAKRTKQITGGNLEERAVKADLNEQIRSELAALLNERQKLLEEIERNSSRRVNPAIVYDSEKAARQAAQDSASKAYVGFMGAWGDQALKDDPRAQLVKLTESLGKFREVFVQGRKYMSGEQGADMARAKMLTGEAFKNYQRQLRGEAADRNRSDRMNELLGSENMPQFAQGIQMINAEIAKAQKEMADARAQLQGAMFSGNAEEATRQRDRQDRASTRYYDLLRQRNEAVRGFANRADARPGTFGDFSAAAALAGAVGQVAVQERIAMSAEEMKKYLQEIYRYLNSGNKTLLMGR